ncbi:hypothetical protein D3C81_2066930 [compost metagenome]
MDNYDNQIRFILGGCNRLERFLIVIDTGYSRFACPRHPFTVRNDTGEAEQGDLNPVPFKILGGVCLLAVLACAYIRNSPCA